jgi:pimeloyl-ACP methyl ester carboxylesterase
VIDMPLTRYAEGDEVSLAYQVFGTGDFDLVFVPGGVSHVDLAWQDRRYARFMRHLGSFARVIVFDKRGMGASDPVVYPPTLEERSADIATVMQAAGVQEAALFGFSEGAMSTASFAARFPQRTRALVLCGAFPGGYELADVEPDYPAEAMQRFWESIVEPWPARFGQGATIELFAPSLAGDERAVAAMAAVERASTTPAMFRALLESLRGTDTRPILAGVLAPTLMIHRRDERVPVEGARYMASRIPGAKLVELDGDDHLPWLGDTDVLVDEIQEFLTGARPRRAERRLATVCFTDIVASTERVAQIGDRRWRALLEDHFGELRSTVERFDGRLVKTTGDGALVLFDEPALALACAREAVGDATRLGIDIRVGVHAGECELIGDDVGGIAIHVGARIAALAAAREVLVSGTVKDLVAGSELAFIDRGTHQLKGLAAEWKLYSLA